MAEVSGSFRDPSGFLFLHEGSLYRQVNQGYREDYDYLMGSGLYQHLVDSGLLVPHEEVDIRLAKGPDAYQLLKPELIPFISYPYEWCFSQLKDAALTTLEIQKKALGYGMILKDSSAYNIQLLKGRPVLIDTLSFERYQEGQPWAAYRQFCQHFLAPLALMGYRDIRLNQLLRVYIDGVPLDLASVLLPLRTRFGFSLLSHLHLHARSQKFFANKAATANGRRMGKLSLLGLIDSLESAVKGIKWQAVRDTEWANYYEDTNYSPEALHHKEQMVAEFLKQANPKSVWDLGANTGRFSRIASDRGIPTVSIDSDTGAVEMNYRECVRRGETNILPLVLDLTNPSPDIGWENTERLSFLRRGPADTALALALVHHLAIGNNLPLERLARFFGKLCNSLIIEFVPKVDSQVKRLLATRKDIFPEYHQNAFENIFGQHFTILSSTPLQDSERSLYLMKRKDSN